MRKLHAHHFEVLPIVVFCVLGGGCQRAELVRLEDQLRQTDKRLEIATAQVEAANAQVASLKESLEQSQAEREQAKQDAAAQVAEAEKKAAIQRQRLEQEKAQLVQVLEDSRRAHADARAQLDEATRQKAARAEELTVLGVWEIPVDARRYRFAFYENGIVHVRRLNAEKAWVDPWPIDLNKGETIPNPNELYLARNFVESKAKEGKTDETAKQYFFQRVDASRFSLFYDPDKKDRMTGEFIVRPNGLGNIRLKTFKSDEYGEWKWYSAKKIAEPDEPNN